MRRCPLHPFCSLPSSMPTSDEVMEEFSADVDSATAIVRPEKLMDSYHSLFCRRCYTYDCRHHGSRPMPSAASRGPPLEIQEPCGPDCWRQGASTHIVAMRANKVNAREDRACKLCIISLINPLFSFLQSSTPLCRQSHCMIASSTPAAGALGLSCSIFRCLSCRRLLSGQHYVCTACKVWRNLGKAEP